MRQLLTGIAASLVMMIATSAAKAQDYPNSGCSSCGSGGCDSSFLSKLKPNFGGCGAFGGCAGCQVSGAWHKFCYCFTGPCKSNAPTCRPDGQLAFPAHPYIRSPRDFFMVD